MNLGRVLGLPVENHLTERSADGSARPIPVEKYYVPGSILRVAVDNTAGAQRLETAEPDEGRLALIRHVLVSQWGYLRGRVASRLFGAAN